MPRPIYQIAEEIRKNWINVNYGAVPYFDAMLFLNKIEDNYGMDSASNIICYFLANARTWRGDVAKRIKVELNSLLNER